MNVVIALLDQAHIHHEAAENWFFTPGLQWALCPFTEAGVLRFFTLPKTGQMSMDEVTDMLETLKRQPGYRYQPVTADWHTLTRPFRKRLHGHNQVTDAFLLGLALREGWSSPPSIRPSSTWPRTIQKAPECSMEQVFQDDWNALCIAHTT